MPIHIVVSDCTYACVALASFSYADEMMPKVGNLALLKLYNRSHPRLELASLRKQWGQCCLPTVPEHEAQFDVDQMTNGTCSGVGS